MYNSEQIPVNGRKGIGKQENGNKDEMVAKGMVTMTIDRGSRKVER